MFWKFPSFWNWIFERENSPFPSCNLSHRRKRSPSTKKQLFFSFLWLQSVLQLVLKSQIPINTYLRGSPDITKIRKCSRIRYKRNHGHITSNTFLKTVNNNYLTSILNFWAKESTNYGFHRIHYFRFYPTSIAWSLLWNNQRKWKIIIRFSFFKSMEHVYAFVKQINVVAAVQ